MVQKSITVIKCNVKLIKENVLNPPMAMHSVSAMRDELVIAAL